MLQTPFYTNKLPFNPKNDSEQFFSLFPEECQAWRKKYSVLTHFVNWKRKSWIKLSTQPKYELQNVIVFMFSKFWVDT